MHCTKISPEFECQGQRSKVKVTRNKRTTAESSPLTMHSKACAVRCVDDTIAGDRVTAVHADGGLWERSSGALRPPVLRRWENQRVLSIVSV